MKKPRQVHQASSTNPAKFLVGELVVFAKPAATGCWTDELDENGNWRDEPFRIYPGTPEIVLRSRIVDDDSMDKGTEIDPEDYDEYCYVVYDLLVNGHTTHGWQEEALSEI